MINNPVFAVERLLKLSFLYFSLKFQCSSHIQSDKSLKIQMKLWQQHKIIDSWVDLEISKRGCAIWVPKVWVPSNDKACSVENDWFKRSLHRTFFTNEKLIFTTLTNFQHCVTSFLSIKLLKMQSSKKMWPPYKINEHQWVMDDFVNRYHIG